jgi:hypothetical protein
MHCITQWILKNRSSQYRPACKKFLWFFIFAVPSFVPAQSLVVGWEETQAQDVAGYKVYLGPASRHYEKCYVTDIANGTIINNLPPYRDIYIAVTAFDSSGNESDYSPEFLFRSDHSLAPFSLNANYPNPFNPVTRIPYVLTTRLDVRLAVYDVLGRRVKLLVDQEMDPGSYEVNWDGRDEYSRPGANGVYFCRMQVGQFCVSRKLILAR